ncbi:hypothetical protein BDV30DRAFT_218568 [Aspergillus minisclerotigenes]|uniref:Uncharacterized protein n=1 Tax=Aspergillus minisclerotigenes TaxID=656917 RepID=A0A5N6IQX9_9EURO|nr:hypothetical protein BDV30DRAFT_218568 [Aspergillus minisclerotigenes]
MTPITLFPLSTLTTATALSAGFLGLGAFHFLSPSWTCSFFGLPCPLANLQIPATSVGKDRLDGQVAPSALPFMYANGGRELMLSIAVWIMGTQRNRQGISALIYGMSLRVHCTKL